MKMVIVPDSLRNAINVKLDAAICTCPGAVKDRDVLYQQLLEHFDEHGVLPDFKLTRVRAQTNSQHPDRRPAK